MSTQNFEGSRTDYIANVLSKTKTLYFAAYNEGRHWVLAAIHPIKRLVFWMDPMHGDVRESFKKMITEAFQKRDSANPLLVNEVNKKIDYSLIKVPKQQINDNTQCGYFVCRFMIELINKNLTHIPTYYIMNSDKT
ncbi:hypothetical protein RND81_13G030900 [Saponaria officinalis]